MFYLNFGKLFLVSIFLMFFLFPFRNSFAQEAFPSVIATTELKSIALGVKVEILALKRTSGDTVTLEFAMVNENDQEVRVVEKHFTLVHRSDVGKITLVDFQNRKRYLVIRDADNNCLCTNGDYSAHRLGPKIRKEFWMKFPAPPQHVTHISIDIPGALPLDDVLISE